MSRSPLLTLWPWLLMATLQAGLGHKGLVLAAAVETERAAAQKAIIRVIPLKMDPTGKSNLTLEGVFARVAEVMPAEGKLLQFHPLSLCNTSEDEHTVPGFVTIVKLESPERDPHPCLSLANKAKLAGERGAEAILFDITDDEGAFNQLQEAMGLTHPVVLIWGHDAELLMEMVNNNQEAQVKIEVKEQPKWPEYDVWILLTVVGTVLAIILYSVFRIRCRENRSQDSLQQQTIRAIGQLATRKYKSHPERGNWRAGHDYASSCSSAPVCAVCLEEFTEGQDLRIISCFHEFHKECVDPWLQQHRTCPLCMYNIVDGESFPRQLISNRSPQSHEAQQRVRLWRQHSGHAHFQPRTTESPPQFYRVDPQALTGQPSINHPVCFPPEVSRLDFSRIHYVPYSTMSVAQQWGQHTSHPRRATAKQMQKVRPLAKPPSYQTCLHQYRHPCLEVRTSRTARHHGAHPEHCGGLHSRQDEGSCSGGSFGTERSGYLADGPGSDSSSGPFHSSSSDSMQNCTDVSLQGVYGSRSTFRSSLSSDYDPLVYFGSENQSPENTAEQHRRGSRPRSLESVPNSSIRAEHQTSSHVHYHHHRHHHYRKSQPCATKGAGQEPGPQPLKASRISGTKVGAQTLKDNTDPEEQRKDKTYYWQHKKRINILPQETLRSGHHHCVQQGLEPLAPTSYSADLTNSDGAASDHPKTGGALRFHLTKRGISQSRQQRRRRSCRTDASMRYSPGHFDVAEDCSVHIHYEHSPSYCCSSEGHPLMPPPFFLDGRLQGNAPLPCYSAPQVVWEQQVHSSEVEGVSGEQDSHPFPLDVRRCTSETEQHMHLFHQGSGEKMEGGVCEHAV
ncbi:E3 ubiquitin-protein ligase RNF43 isoform X2 [Rhinatrema bivittatum]|uniref:E3 ubiquitin-protein ligase RNF43 isoform X2 n=1 Tax=Rhinatrema bivittatum TaxID=194408 RepID=UPI00112B91BC|nr:E3 ubiquitin-protein ligase RNF43 isoform X2 [Rhinatrema bivittatum]